MFIKYECARIVYGDFMTDIILAKTDLGVFVDGGDLGPDAIIKNVDIKDSLLYSVEKENITKSKSSLDLRKNVDPINKFNEELYKKVLEVKSKGNIPLTIGGDHSIAIGSALGSIKKEEKLGIIWVDSHADFNNFDSTITGNIHGMPFSTITDNNGRDLSYFHDGNYYNPLNAVAIGTRDYYPVELEEQLLRDSGVTVYTTLDLINNNIESIVKEAFDIALRDTNGVHISYDLDTMDPDAAPGVSIPAPNGINAVIANKILDEILKYKDHIKSFDIVEFNPLNDKDDITLNIACEMVEKIISLLS